MAVDTEQKILETARKHFVQRGFAGTRTEAIAEEAGITKAMVHYYFRKKQDLYERVIGQVLDQIMPMFAQAIGSEGPVLEKIERIIHTYIETLSKYPDIPFFIMSELSQKREDFIKELQKRSHHFPALMVFVKDIHEAIETGTIRKVEPVHLVLNIIGMCVFPFMAKPIFSNIIGINEEQFDDLMRARAPIVVDFVKHALKPG